MRSPTPPPATGTLGLVPRLLCALSAASALGCASGPDFYARYSRTCREATLATSSGARATRAQRAKIIGPLVDALNRREPAVRDCYNQALAYGDLHGRVEVQALVGPDGRLLELAAPVNTTGSSALACCVVAAVHDVRLPADARRQPFRLDYPFSFRTVEPPELDTSPFQYSQARADGFEVVLDGRQIGRASLTVGGSRDGGGRDATHHLTQFEYAAPGPSTGDRQ